MRIDELDEWQGLTADMMPKWLVANGWQRMSAQDMPRSECWVRKGGAGGTIWIGVESSAEKTLSKLAVWMDCSVQALLREINPRMRKGMPSEAAREAHGFKGGMWVGSRGEAGSGGTLVFVSFDDSSSGLPLTVWDFSEFDTWEVGQSEIDDEWLFWPADESGNKTRWPTDAQGNML